MNNLNNPDDWNIGPERQGDGDSSKWNYALLVHMLGFAVSGWIWSRESQKEIEQAKVKYTLASQSYLKEEQRKKKEALEKEKDREQKVLNFLTKVENELVERQRAFCSISVPRARRVEMEKALLDWTAKEPLLAHLEMKDGLSNIFNNDCSCAETRNIDGRRNGCLMWLYIKYWKLQDTLQTHKRVEAAVLGLQTKK